MGFLSVETHTEGLSVVDSMQCRIGHTVPRLFRGDGDEALGDALLISLGNTTDVNTRTDTLCLKEHQTGIGRIVLIRKT